jgi:hypothetical protein
MSLVLGKPRSATCLVASDTAAVAEVARSAVARLLDARPCLARELEELVHRRDAANVLALARAGGERATRALLAYRERGAAPAAGGGLAPAGGGAPAAGDEARTASPAGRVTRRITRPRSTLGGACAGGAGGGAAPPRPATASIRVTAAAAAAAGRPLSAAAAAAAAGGLGRPRFSRMTGRWVKGCGAHILLPS